MERGWIFINARELRLNRLDRLVNELFLYIGLES